MSEKNEAINQIFERTVSALETLEWSRQPVSNQRKVADQVIEVANACREAGHEDLANSLIEAIPVQRGYMLLKTGNHNADAAVDALMEEYEAVSSTSKNDAAAFLLAASAELRERTDRAQELDAAVAELVDEKLEKEFQRGSLGGILAAYVARGDHAAARRILEAQDSSRSLSSDMAFAVWLLKDPEKILEIDCYWHQAISSDLVDLEGWSVEQIARLADKKRSYSLKLAERLVKEGRTEDAKALVFDPDYTSGWTPSPTQKAKLFELFGDEDAASKAWEEADAKIPSDNFGDWVVREFERGTAFEEIVQRVASRKPDQSTMGSIGLVISAAKTMLSLDSKADVSSAIETVEALFAEPFRNQYDLGIEGDMLNRFNYLKAQVLLANGQKDQAEAEVEEALADIKTLLEFARLGVRAKDRKAQSFSASGLAFGLAHRAILVGRPDLAVKAASKAPKSHRADHAVKIARAFLPNVGDSLDVLDKLAKPRHNEVLLGVPRNENFLVEVWNVALSQND